MIAYFYSMDNTWFKDWFNSAYYHELYANRDEAEAARFITNLLNYLHPKASSKLLDVACGKGRHSIFLAEKGFDVTGIDLSKESIAEAKQSEHENLHFMEHDMRMPFWINYFDIAFNFFTSFGYFNSDREHNQAIASIVKSVKHNGIFVIDYFNASLVKQQMEKELVKKIGNSQYHISKWHTDKHIFKKIIVENPKLPMPMQYTEKVAAFGISDFEKMLSKNNVEIVDIFGNYSLAKFDEAVSTRLIIIGRKK
jgi:SAM-dependent methyltransferase